MEEEEAYDYGDDYEYQVDYPLERGPSKEKDYDVLELDDILKKINEDNQSKLMLTCLPEAWNLMLYYFCDFSETELYKVIDQEATGRKMIRFESGYEPTTSKGQCLTCCDYTNLVKNTCGHACCYECWKGFLTFNHSDRSQY